MDLARVSCLILVMGFCLSPNAFVPVIHSNATSNSVEDKVEKLKKEKWMKPMLTTKKRIC